MNLVGQISWLKPKPKLKSKQQHTDNTTWHQGLWMKAIRSPSYVSQKPKPILGTHHCSLPLGPSLCITHSALQEFTRMQ